jgi:predicted RND superfamily exporter protein
MKRKTFYRILLVIVLVLTVVYTLGIMGLIPFRWSYYITLFMIVLFFYLKLDKMTRGD